MKEKIAKIEKELDSEGQSLYIIFTDMFSCEKGNAYVI